VIPFWSTISGCIENVKTISSFLWTSQMVYGTTSKNPSTPSSSKNLAESLKCIFCQMDISNIHILAWRHIAKAYHQPISKEINFFFFQIKQSRDRRRR
jgi:hypothetical protein